MRETVIGCALARSFIDIHSLPDGRHRCIANTSEAIAAWAETLPADGLVVLEETSGCDAELMAMLTARGRRFSRVNPRQARGCARATGVLAKTDRLDAKVLAEMGRKTIVADHGPDIARAAAPR